MPNITLPDNSQRSFTHPISVHEVAASIGAGLAKAALAAKVDDKLVDTSYVIDRDCHLAIITEKSEEALEIIRHSAAHLVAQAAKQLFPEIQVTIGPVIEDGFFYDFSFKQRTLTPDDLIAIEKRMEEITKQDLPIKRIEMPRDQAIKFFRDRGEEYKAKIIEDIPATETLSLYEQGDFTDLCRGPHVPSTGKLKIFKLLKVAGAYWRGDSNNEMLQRVYGTAWVNKEQLAQYLTRLEEAEKRDHRKIAKQLDLFHQQEEAPGMVFWHPNGWVIYREVENYIRQIIGKNGYVEVKTPQIIDRKLWERSGHWQNYREDMFVTESEERQFVIKPMSCPAHIEIFNQGIKSYRELPLRMAEFGSCHRNEASGALHGLMRVRNFVQDDAHIFCMEEQIKSESAAFINLAMQTYKDFGFDDVIVLLSTRPAKRIGDDAFWDKTEKFLEEALNETGLPWRISPGDGAFYAPKIDFSLRDCIGRIWQVGTLQLDYNLPARLGAEYIAQDGNRKMPVMLHRAIVGSIERFVGILIENYAGKLPLWLAPQQAVVMNITDRQADYATKVVEILKNQGVRAKTDLRNEKISFKIREHTLQRIPYLLTVGEREMEAGTASIRTQSGEDLGVLSVEKLCERLLNEIKQRSSINV